MKLIAIILSALLTCGVCATAEEYVKGITGKGIRLGGGWRSLSTNSDAFEEGSSGGFMAGVFVTYNLSPKAAIQPELVYAEKGGATSNLFYSAGLESNYLELPVLFKYTLTPPRRLTPSLFVGPAVSTLLSANLFSHLFFGDEEHDIKDGLKSMDVSVVLGGDLEFQSFKSLNFVLDVRYTLGLVNVVDPAKWNAGRKVVDEGDIGPIHWTDHNRPLLASDASAKNRMFSFMVGVKFL